VSAPDWSSQQQPEPRNRSQGSDIPPRLVLSTRGESPANIAGMPPAHVTRLAELLLKTQERPSLEFVREVAEEGHGLTSLVVDLLGPATRLVGAAWAEDRVGFLEAGIAYGRVQQLLRRLSQEFDPGPADLLRAGRVLLTVPEGETHTLGLFSLAELLLRDRWEVVLGRPVLEASPATLVHTEWFDAVLISAAQERLLPVVQQEVTRLRQRSRNPDLCVMVGGNLTVLVPDAHVRVGANGGGSEADAVSSRLLEALAAEGT
jgi:MerR family transcriptional regulator, light-induced transcriptional regulator